jgi:mycothiol synthase
VADEAPTDDGIVLGPVTSADATEVASALTEAEQDAGGELVDEAERRRLDAFAADRPAPPRWTPFVARHGDALVAYAALSLPVERGGDATGEVAVLPAADDPAWVRGEVLAHLADLAGALGAGHVQVWSRRVHDGDLDAAAAAGVPAERRLAVLGRSLPVDDGGPVPTPPAGVRIRAFTDEDEAEVVRVLAAAYAGTPDGGWDREAFRTKRGWDWFRSQDLLVADRGDGHLLGLHWLKRRDATTGEVHNLAVAPDARGLGLGGVLLRAGLDHLSAIGCDEVLLWVDRANERAVRLYTAQGMTTRWEDVAFGRALIVGAP